MDLQLVPHAEPSDDERAALDMALGPPTSAWDGGSRAVGHDANTAAGGHDARARRHLLLPALWALQERVGWISPGGLNEVCRRLTVPPADAYGVASFYALLALEPQPRRVVHVCDDIACRCDGADAIVAQLEERFGPEGSSGPDGSATWYRSPCLGQCDRAPAALVSIAGGEPLERAQAPTSAADVLALLADGEPAPSPATALPQSGDGSLRLLRRVGVVDPGSLDDYRAEGGYAALRRAIELGPEGVLREVKDSKLLGRGGAAFPAGMKWEAVARQPAWPHYLVCNADESEPGTFKDRALLEGDPFALVEAMTIAAYATGCAHGYVYLRGEYPEALHALERALAEARRRGFLGPDVMREGFAFDMEIRRGAGAYICGEETAIFESIEGRRGEPRNKPPFPVEEGLFRKPTLVNNVETLVNVLDVVLRSGPVFAETGTEQSSGTKLLCLSGHVGAAGNVRGRVRRDRARRARPRRRGTRRPAAPGGARRRRSRELSRARRPGRASHVRGHAGRGDESGLGGGARPRRHGRSRSAPDANRRVLPGRVLRPVRPVPGGDGPPGGGARPAPRGRAARRGRARARADRGGRAMHARRLDLRARADGLECGRVGDRPARRVRRSDVSQLLAPTRMIELEVDGQPVRVFEGATILDACLQLGIDTPTLCYGETLQPANVCRVCVVELEGARVLAPACSRTAEAGMQVRTDSERVRLSRKLVLELLASSVDLSTTPVAPGYLDRYDASARAVRAARAAERRA